MIKMILKRVFDILIAFIALIILSPILLIISFFILIRMGTPIIFTQRRPGKDGKIFNIIKFRTMLNDKDANGNYLPDEQRLTQFGIWLRNSSLDELPELINVLKGEMSIVGPRPLLIEYLPLYSDHQARRHDVLPGITGWAQINGRNALTWDEKFNFDVWYVDNHNILLDIKIILRTVSKVLDKSGIDDDIGVGQEKFKGNKSSYND
jgi:lipopolysaccharide/colanic/teichoic acid biosynthesis glycosyltransferase